MIFEVGIDTLESDKERNLYTKFFGGYYFNEFIDGYENRVSAINYYLSEKLKTNIGIVNPFVSFDNHGYMLGIDIDNGEFSDVFLHDKTQKTIIAIEVKYHSNLNIKKDFDSNLKRIKAIRQKHPEYTVHFCILISETKWNAAEKMKGRHDVSSYSKYEMSYKNEIGLLFWEDLVKLCKSEKVRDYMNYKLNLVNAERSNRFAKI
ncbi:MAG: hypothetical protein QNK36_20300 [Colwellia sp.]|nr:hypothetical protein [Colwellia sp.]